MEGDNAYLCEELGRRVPAVKRACIKAPPHALVVHLKRFEFDYHSQTRFKVRDRFEFPCELDLLPYTAAGLAAAEGADGGADAGGGDGEPLLYDLAGVVVHSGSAFTGHYYSYARDRAALADPAQRGGRRGWFRFDDKAVRPWDPANLERDCFGGLPSQDAANRGWRPPRGEVERPNSAYMLFYERRCKAHLNAAALRDCSRSLQRQQQQQQQQQQHEGAAVNAAPAAAGEQQQQQADSVVEDGVAPAALSGGGAGGFAAPWGMPASLYREVMLANIAVAQRRHALDREFLRFVRALVENRGDVGGQLSQRKARRRELPPPAPTLQPAPALHAAAGAAGAVGSGGSCSAMSCDAASGAAAPAPATMDASGAAAAGVGGGGSGGSRAPEALSNGAAGGATTPGSAAEQLPSPGPSSRRGEEAERVAVALTRLALRFHLQLYQHAAPALRGDSAVWSEALKSLLNTGPTAGACQLAALQLLCAQAGWLREALVAAPDAGVRHFVGDLVGSLLAHAAARSGLHVVAPQLLAASEAGALDAALQQAAQVPAVQPAAALVTLVNSLATLLVSTASAAAAPNPPDEYLGAVAAALRDYVTGAPAVHGAVLLATRSDVVAALATHLHTMFTYTDGGEELAAEGPHVVKLLHALVSRASNFEALVAEFAAENGPGYDGQPPPPAGPNPYAAQARTAPGCVVEACLSRRAFQRLFEPEFLGVLCSPALILHCVPETVALLQLLSWANHVATLAVTPKLLNAALQLSGSLVVQYLPMMVQPIRDVLTLADNQVFWRCLHALFGNGGCSLLGALADASSSGWLPALRKMLLAACFEPALQLLEPEQRRHVLGLALQQYSPVNLAGSLAWAEQDLDNLPAEHAAVLEPLVRQHLPSLQRLKVLAASVQLPHVMRGAFAAAGEDAGGGADDGSGSMQDEGESSSGGAHGEQQESEGAAALDDDA